MSVQYFCDRCGVRLHVCNETDWNLPTLDGKGEDVTILTKDYNLCETCLFTIASKITKFLKVTP
jgi:hypothetical protein